MPPRAGAAGGAGEERAPGNPTMPAAPAGNPSPLPGPLHRETPTQSRARVGIGKGGIRGRLRRAGPAPAAEGAQGNRPSSRRG